MEKLWMACGVALVASALAGCGSTTFSSAGTQRTVYTSDLKTLAGTWQGTGRGATGDNIPATLRLNPDGTYSLQAGPWTAQGKAQVVDGALVFVATGGGTGRGEGAAAAVWGEAQSLLRPHSVLARTLKNVQRPVWAW